MPTAEKNCRSDEIATRKPLNLVASEEEHRLYREAVTRIVCDLQPHLEVKASEPDALGSAIARLDPILGICSRPNSVSPNGGPAWFELRPEPDGFGLFCLDGEYSRTPNPALEELIRAVDEAEELARTKQDLGGCESPADMR